MTWAVIPVTTHGDERGRLSSLDGVQFPFPPQRLFWVYDVPVGMVRGAHAHREQSQFLVCLAGSVEIPLDDGRRRETVILDRPDRGLLIPPLVWSSQTALVPGSRWLVIASGPYLPDEYLTTPSAWQTAVQRAHP